MVPMSVGADILPPHFVRKYPKDIGSNEIRDASGQKGDAWKWMKGHCIRTDISQLLAKLITVRHHKGD